MLEKMQEETVGPKIRFENAALMDKYFAERIREARQEICSLMWQDDDSRKVEFDRGREIRHDAIFESVNIFCQKENSAYQELFTFSFPPRYNIMKSRFSCGKSYQCRYYDNFALPVEARFPKLQFRIIDNEEVIFASRNYGNNLCAIRDPHLAGIMRTYFDMAWRNAIHITPAVGEDDKTEAVCNKIEADIQFYLG